MDSPAFRLSDQPIPADPPFDPTVKSGALASFEGRVRDHNHGKAVTGLAYSAYPALAEREGSRIIAEAIARFGLVAAACIHRVGELLPGDTAIRAWAASPHRQAAFLACAFIVDEVKARVPIWKLETYADGQREWVACDHHPNQSNAERSSPQAP